MDLHALFTQGGNYINVIWWKLDTELHMEIELPN